MALSDVVIVNVAVTNVGAQRDGYGIPLILESPSWATDKVRTYTDIAGVAADFAVTRPGYLAAAQIFAQEPRVKSIRIGKVGALTQTWTITPVVVNSATYSIYVNGTLFSYVADSSATAAEIVTGLKAAITSGAGWPTSSGSTTLILTSELAGNWYNVQAADPALLTLVQDTVDVSLAADLAAIALVDNGWYDVVNPWPSTATSAIIATYVEANTKFQHADSQDANCATHALSGATDVMAAQKTANHKRTAVMYHPDNAQFAAAAWQGRCLPLAPGSETWALKTLADVATVTPQLTATMRANILAKNGNVYETIAGRDVTNKGTAADGSYIDQTRFLDWLKSNMAVDVFELLADNDKVPYTDAGVAMIASKVRARLKLGAQAGGLAVYDVQVTPVADADPGDKAARLCKCVKFSGTLSGAIGSVDIEGSLS